MWSSSKKCTLLILAVGSIMRAVCDYLHTGPLENYNANEDRHNATLRCRDRPVSDMHPSGSVLVPGNAQGCDVQGGAEDGEEHFAGSLPRQGHPRQGWDGLAWRHVTQECYVTQKRHVAKELGRHVTQVPGRQVAARGVAGGQMSQY